MGSVTGEVSKSCRLRKSWLGAGTPKTAASRRRGAHGASVKLDQGKQGKNHDLWMQRMNEVSSRRSGLCADLRFGPVFCLKNRKAQFSRAKCGDIDGAAARIA